MSHNQFQQVQVKRPTTSKFNLSHEKKMSFNMGELVPFFLQEIMPGDRFKVSSEVLIRFAPLVSPVMHQINVYTHYFFVPNRLVWDEWEDFITGGEDGSLTPSWPSMSINQTRKSYFYEGTLSDYFGIPLPPTSSTVDQSNTIGIMPFRAYQMIYNEYYRDQNLTDKVVYVTTSGVVTDDTQMAALAQLRVRAWEKDYFTSALPWAQRLASPVNLPINANFSPQYEDESWTDPPIVSGNIDTDAVGLIEGGGTSTIIKSLSDPQEITNSTLSINDLRTSIRLQEWLEKNARGGSRYIEQLLHHFGVSSSNKLLQRPQFLGGAKNPVIISEVLNTTGTSGELPQGNMAGHGISYGKGNGFTKYFEEHGFVIGIMSVIPRTSYQQGVEKMWKRFDKLDYPWPEFAQLGEQEVTQSEIYFDYEGSVGQKDLTFGYQARYAEYKYAQSSVHGEFRDSPLYTWHEGRIFATDPALNTAFVECDPDTLHRIFAVTTTTIDKLYCQIYNKVSAIRPLPYFNNPTL